MKLCSKALAITSIAALLTGSLPAFAQAPAGDAKSGQPAAAGTSAAKPSADAIKEARSRYERGTQLYKDGDYKLALIEFQRAYELAPNYRILYNIGQVNFQLNNYADALRALQEYVKEGDKEITGKRREEVDKEIQSLTARTAHITIVTDVDGAELSVDDKVMGTSPLPASLLVDAGQHRVTATKAGRQTATKDVTLAGSDDVKIELQLPELPSTPVATMPATEQPRVVVIPPTQQTPLAPPPPPQPSYTWLGWVATGALTAGAAATGIAALSASRDLRDMRDTIGTTREGLDSQQSKTRGLAIATDVLGGCAIIVGAITLTATLTSGPSKPKKGSAGTVQVGVGPTGVMATGAF